MTQEETIEMAIHAGYNPYEFTTLTTLERFAKLVAEKEREKCAEIAKWHREIAHEIRRRGQT